MLQCERGVMRRLALPLLLVLGCQEDDSGRPSTGLETLGLDSVEPTVALPGTRFDIVGRSFLDEPLGISWMRLNGSFAGRPINLELPAVFDDFDKMHVDNDDRTMSILGGDEGTFNGQVNVVVDYVPEATRHQSLPLSMTIEFVPELTPEVDELLDTGAIFVNEPISIRGSGLLLGGDEGSTIAVVEGCFTPLGEEGCEEVGPVEIPVVPETPYDRENGSFPFAPQIAGIMPGSFDGAVQLRNVHADGTETESDKHMVHYDLIETTISSIGDGGSLGQYIDIEGGGFVGGEAADGITVLQIQGEFFPAGASQGIPVPTIPIIPEFVDGQNIRYILNEQDALGMALQAQGGVRYADGDFVGTVQAVVQYGNDELIGPETPIDFAIRPVKQVVWVKFTPSYVVCLRKFGMRALDARIRERVLEVMRRDYETINVELRTEEPTDFALFATVEISGPDPNGLGLLGYDNTPGKDHNNDRLFDRIGGVNALTQEDGYAGYGGVFIESIFTFSQHPPRGITAEVPTPLFDKIFDTFREDRGTPVSSADEADGGIPVLSSGVDCPGSDRKMRAACAVWTLGSLIGTTTSHELGHSLGLADPTGTAFHNLGDGPNRLMDAGGARSFEERAELEGMGPSMFCDSEYTYLRNILPTDEGPTTFERPFC
jgi:hypothetical protein